MHVHLLNLLHRALRVILNVLVMQVLFSDRDAILVTYCRMIRGQNRRYLVHGTMIAVFAAALRRAPNIHGPLFSIRLISSTLRGLHWQLITIYGVAIAHLAPVDLLQTYLYAGIP